VRVRTALLLILVSLVTIPGCATFHLSNQTGILPIQRQRAATDETLAVCGFTYETLASNDTPLEALDLQRWQNIVVAGLNQANIFADVVPCAGDEVPASASYVLDGRITRFRFQKNWVPTFFPLHLGLSFFTFTGYTLFGGPTTMTIVRFAVDFELRRADTGEILLSWTRNYRSTRAVNIYSKGAGNPYDNPNLVFADVLGSAAISIAEALPDDSEARPAANLTPRSDLPIQSAPVAPSEPRPATAEEVPPETSIQPAPAPTWEPPPDTPLESPSATSPDPTSES
jgi:hypothetical protein